MSSKKKELKPGDVVCKNVNDVYIARLQNIGHEETAAQRMLTRTSRSWADVWGDLVEDYGLNENYSYSVDHIAKTITVIGRKREK